MTGKQAGKELSAAQLRAEAEEKLARAIGARDKTSDLPGDEILHELMVHQIELEMQNEELRRTQIALEESRDRYVDLYDFAPVGYLTLTREGLISEINLTGATLLGQERGKLIQRRFAQFVAVEVRDHWHRYFLHMMQHGGKQSCELTFCRGDGSIFHGRLDCLHVANDEKNPSLRMILTDITEDKQAEENLRIAATAFESQEGIMITDASKTLLRVNNAFTHITGYSADEAVGKTPRLLNSGHQGADFYAAMWDSIHRTGSWAGEIWNKRKNGEIYPEYLAITAIKGEDNTVTHYVGTLIDITKIRQAENALRTSEERLQLAKRTAGFGIFDRDLTSGTLHWDERSRELWGLAPEEAVTYEKFVAGIHPDDLAARQAALDRALDPAGNGEYSTEYRVIRRNDGTTRWVATTGKVFFESGHAVRLVGVMQDITEHKILEQRLREHRAERESLLGQQVAAQTASAIAHELNQPLAAISAYSEVAQRALGSDAVNSVTLSHALKGCVEQAQRAGRSLHELLDFLQKGDLATEPMDINNLVREALSVAQHDGFGGFHPTLELEAGLPPVLGNRVQVQKVLVNLLRNGVEAMREAGVPASAITVRVQTMAGKNMAQVTVQDSGPGLDIETASKVFEPFFTTKPSGIGLGLAISRSLIEANGGQLWLDPDAEPGATFHFTLPFAP